MTLKLKTADFKALTRSRRLRAATQLAEVLYHEALPLLARAAAGKRFRLIGIGASDLTGAQAADQPELFGDGDRRAAVERAVDAVRDRFGDRALFKGRSMGPNPKPATKNKGGP